MCVYREMSSFSRSVYLEFRLFHSVDANKLITGRSVSRRASLRCCPPVQELKMLLLANDCVSVEVTDDCVHVSELAWLLWDFVDLMAIVLLKAPSSNFIAFSPRKRRRE